MQVTFSECGERFTGIGEGGVVATWRVDAPRIAASDTGALGRADWCHQVFLDLLNRADLCAVRLNWEFWHCNEASRCAQLTSCQRHHLSWVTAIVRWNHSTRKHVIVHLSRDNEFE